MVKIVVNYEKCVGDHEEICVEICPAYVFRKRESEKPRIVNEEKCTMCRSCQFNCPGQAIQILP